MLEPPADRRLHARLAEVSVHTSRRVEPTGSQPGSHVGFVEHLTDDAEPALEHADPVDRSARVGGRRTEPVLVGVVVARRLDESDQGGVEGRETTHERLRRDASGFEDGPAGRRPQPVGGAVDVDRAAVGGDLALVEHDPVRVDVPHPPMPDDPLDLLEALLLGSLTMAPRNIVGSTAGSSRRSSPHRLEPAEEVLEAARPRRGTAARRDRLSTVPTTRSSGWKDDRFSNHASRGRTQRIFSGSTSLSSRKLQASIAVLPAPSTVKPDGGSVTLTRSPTGISVAPSPTVKAGGALPAPTSRDRWRRRASGGPARSWSRR